MIDKLIFFGIGIFAIYSASRLMRKDPCTVCAGKQYCSGSCRRGRG